MKNLFICIAAGLLAFLGAAEFSPGGTAFEMKNFAPKPVKKAAAQNLLKNGGFEMPGTSIAGWHGKGFWTGWANIHGKSEKRKELMPLFVRKLETKDAASGKACAHLTTPATVMKVDSSRPMISNKIGQTVEIPSVPQITAWQLSFKAKGIHIPGTRENSLTVFCSPQNPNPKKPKRSIANGKTIQRGMLLPKQWTDVSIPLQIPANTSRIAVTIALYGMGEMFLDDICLAPAAPAEKIEVRATPFSFMDNLYAVGENLPGVINFAFSSPNAPKRRKLTLDVTLPAGFEAIDSRDIAKILARTKNADGTTTVKLDLMRLGNVAFTRRYYMLQAVSLMVKAPGIKAGEKLYPLTYRLSDGAWQGQSRTLNLKVIPAVAGVRPKNFRSSAMFGHEFTFDGAGVQEAVNFYDKSGFSAIHGAEGKFAVATKQLGIPRYKGNYWICNGFRLGAAKKPDYAQFKMADGKPFPRKICPVEVYTEGPYYKEHVRGILANDFVKNDIADNLMPNWEPYYLDGKGCFCDRCKAEFIRWAAGKPSRKEIESAWPKNTLRVHGERWMKFRSWQHGRLAATLEKSCRELGKSTGKDSHFVPEISWRSMTFNYNNYCKQYNVLDYFDDLPWIEPWGPYNFYEIGTLYNYYPTAHLNAYAAAKLMKEFARAKAKPGKEPKLIAFPHGHQGELWVTEPEAIAFEVLCFFMQKWEGAFLYYFPRGYDYRYWGAMAKANTLIAENEDFVQKGTDITKQVKVIGKSPLPQNLYYSPSFADLDPKTALIPGLSKLKAVQVQAFKRNGEYLVAVGNFWLKGEHFFTLQVKDLPKGSYQVIAEKCDLGTFTEKQLAQGILLQVGALRWQFVRITPRKQSLKPFTQAQMKALYKTSLPQIQKAAAEELKLYNELQASAAAENPVNDLSKFAPVSNNKVTIKAAAPNLQVTTPKYSVQVALTCGGELINLQSRGEELAGNGKDGWLFRPGFWYPKKAACQILSTLKLDSVTKTVNGVQVEMSRTITPKDNFLLAGVHLTMLYEFAPDTINVTAKLKNTTIDAVEHAFRFQSLPDILGKKGSQTGKAVFGDKVVYERHWLEQLYRIGEPDPLLEKAFRMDKVQSSTSRSVTLSAPYFKSKMQVSLPATVRQIIFWDSTKQQNSTFEPVYDRVILAPGATTQYTLKAVIL